MFGRRLKAVFEMKCPQCLKGDFFISRPYDLKNAGKTYPKCKNCGCDFEREPGYYFGALYVSYALGVAMFATIYWSFVLFTDDFNVWWPISLIAISSVVVGPYLYALSKIIWISFFVKPGEEAKQKPKKE